VFLVNEKATFHFLSDVLNFDLIKVNSLQYLSKAESKEEFEEEGGVRTVWGFVSRMHISTGVNSFLSCMTDLDATFSSAGTASRKTDSHGTVCS
jgi:hypothetical protein